MIVDSLTVYLKGYRDAEYILEGFAGGFSLGLQKDPRLKAIKKTFYPKKELRNKIQDEVDKGRIIGPFSSTPVRDLMISPVTVIPKPNSSKVRMIFNLSEPKGASVNDNIPEENTSVSYCSVRQVVQWISQDDEVDWYLAKADLSDAYRMVPIKKGEWKFLGMKVGDDVYIDRCLPMGAASSCAIFQRISDAITWMATSSCPAAITVFNYLDDFLFLADGRENCKKSLSNFLHLCEATGIPISEEKTTEPDTCLTFLGIGIDAKNKVLYIPPEKAKKTLDSLNDFLKKRRHRVREWQSILGKLSHLCEVIIPGRAHLGSVYASLKGILSQQKYLYRSITSEAREDLMIWKQFLEQLPPTKSFRMFSSDTSDIYIYTDASQTVGFGATCQRDWFFGHWPSSEWKDVNIAVLELYPILAALHVWKDTVSEKNITVYSDNHAVVNVLTKLYAREKGMRQLLKPIALFCLNHNVAIKACHIEGPLNVGPDLLSRGKISQFRYRFPHMNPHPQLIPSSISPDKFNLENIKTS